MRTTLDIDDSVLMAAKEVAGAQGVSAGSIISEWARRGLAQPSAGRRVAKSGFPVFAVPSDAKPLTTATVNSLIDDEGLPPRR
jgi:hypothetical protein